VLTGIAGPGTWVPQRIGYGRSSITIDGFKAIVAHNAGKPLTPQQRAKILNRWMTMHRWAEKTYFKPRKKDGATIIQFYKGRELQAVSKAIGERAAAEIRRLVKSFTTR
jgi:hypothetical protein